MPVAAVLNTDGSRGRSSSPGPSKDEQGTCKSTNGRTLSINSPECKMGGESRDSRTEIPWFCKSSEKACQGRLTSVLSVLTMNVKYRASGEESVYIAL